MEEPSSPAQLPPVPPAVIGLCLVLAAVLAVVFLVAAQVVHTL